MPAAPSLLVAAAACLWSVLLLLPWPGAAAQKASSGTFVQQINPPSASTTPFIPRLDLQTYVGQTWTDTGVVKVGNANGANYAEVTCCSESPWYVA